MVSQNAIPSRKHLGGYLPYAFTEHGALMLSSVLNSERATHVGIFIVRTFIKMRELLSSHTDALKKIEALENRYDKRFTVVFDAIKELMCPTVKPKKKIGFIRDEE